MRATKLLVFLVIYYVATATAEKEEAKLNYDSLSRDQFSVSPLLGDETMTSAGDETTSTSTSGQEQAKSELVDQSTTSSSNSPSSSGSTSLLASSGSALSSSHSSSLLVKETVMVSALEGKIRRGVVVHGILMYVPFGLLFPLGIVTARFLQLARRHHPHPYLLRPLFFAHLLIQWLGIIIMTAGAILSFFDFGFFMIHTHGRLGLCLWILIWLQALTSISRPNLGTKTRTVWYFAHWLMGTSSVLLGFYDFYSGIYMWEQRAFSSAKIVNVSFSVSLALMVAVYFLQDRWENLMLQHQKNHDNNKENPRVHRDENNNKENPRVHRDENNDNVMTLSYV